MVSALDSGLNSPGSSPGRGTALCSWAIHFTLKRKKRSHVRARPCVELAHYLLSNKVYQRIELTFTHRSACVYVSRALCIIVLRTRGSDFSVILRGLKKK